MEATQVDQYATQSEPFVGRWNELVSTTNWEKGRIIHQWRAELIALGAPPNEYSDETWSQRVGNVTSQHVGRLRRVWDRFGAVHDEYEQLYWSHFHAAIDWDDAEMWLEGAIQNDWSISQMRKSRWETLGGLAENEPREADVVSADWDEDADPTAERTSGEPIEASLTDVDGAARKHRNDEENEEDEDDDASGRSARAERERMADGVETAPIRPFAEVPSLPADLSEAMESFKLAILRHRVSGWDDVSQEDVISALRALEALVLAPADEE